MQSRIHQFEIGVSRNIPVFEARDTSSGEEVLLYEWTPAIQDRAAAKERLARIASSLEQEVFTADASIFLVNRSEAATQRTLTVLRENGLFPPLQITAGGKGAEVAISAPKAEALPAPVVVPARTDLATPVQPALFASVAEEPKKKGMSWLGALLLAFLIYVFFKIVGVGGFGVFLAICFLLVFLLVRFARWAGTK